MSRPFALTLAERARTVLAGSTTFRVRVPGLTLDIHRHAITPDGAVLFGAPPELALERADAVATDVSAVPQPDRVRGVVTLSGPLSEVTDPLPVGMRSHLTGSGTTDRRILRITPEEVHLDWRCERPGGVPVPIAIGSYRTAFPDPLVGYESEWLPHVQSGHGEILERLARFELGCEDDALDVRALGLDRYGIVLRVTDAEGRFDMRLPFERAVTCGCDVREAFGALLSRVA